MERALSLVHRERIIFGYGDLPQGYYGYYQWRYQKPAIILISRTIEHGPYALLRSVLWEEVGHHFTVKPVDLFGRLTLYGKRVYRSAQEYRALEWAARHIIEPDEWMEALKQGDLSLTTLADFWQVTMEMAAMIVHVNCPTCREWQWQQYTA